MAKQQTDFIDVLRAALKKDGRSSYALAQAAGVTPIMVSRFLRGSAISLPTFQKLCRVLGFKLVRE